jgi:hypothetical protein
MATNRHTTGTFSSSLPPSSPPSASSHLPEHNVNDQLSSLPILDSDDEINCVPAEDGDRLDIADSDEDSDPFGFFALEKKLKAQRVVVSEKFKAR